VTGRIGEAFSRARADKRPALVIYLCAGHPDLDRTPDLICAAADAGADVIELGVPFSDPTADGPAIARASEKALQGGATLARVLSRAEQARRRTTVPILLFGYYNPILAYGEARLVADGKRAGIDGFLVVDLPPEECSVLRLPAIEAGLEYVPLVAPTSSEARIRMAASVATSVLYYVAVTGVTGSSATDLEGAARRAAAVREQTKCPVAVGFGVKTPADVKKLAPHVDGIVVGSAIIQAIDGATDPVAAVRSLVTTLAQALR